MLAFSLLLVTAAVPPPQEPLRIGVVAVDADSGDMHFVRGARAAVAKQTEGKVELLIEPATTLAEATAAVEKLRTAGVAGIVAPPNPWLAEAVRKAAGPKLPCVSFAAPSSAFVPVLDWLVERTFCMTRVGFVRDQSTRAKDLGKLLGKDLKPPTVVLLELDVAMTAKALEKEWAGQRPELLVIDADPPAVVSFLTKTLGPEPMPIVLTPRSAGDAVRALDRRLFVVHGQSPATVAMTSAFRAEYEKQHGAPLLGVAEGFEGTGALVRACRAGGDAAAIGAALAAAVLEGVRGRYGYNAAAAGFTPPLAVWALVAGA